MTIKPANLCDVCRHCYFERESNKWRLPANRICNHLRRCYEPNSIGELKAARDAVTDEILSCGSKSAFPKQC